MKKYLIVLSLILFAGITNAQTKDTATKKEPEVFTPVEITADFPGGMEKLFNFIEKNRKQTGDNGTVRIIFVVEKDGSLIDYKIVNKLSSEADAEAIRVMKLSPKWKPAMQNNNPVRMQFTLPIRFSN